MTLDSSRRKAAKSSGEREAAVSVPSRASISLSRASCSVWIVPSNSLFRSEDARFFAQEGGKILGRARGCGLGSVAREYLLEPGVLQRLDRPVEQPLHDVAWSTCRGEEPVPDRQVV